MNRSARVTSRRMFGGSGLFNDGVMIALIADAELYLKTDDVSRPQFEAQGLPAFTYSKTATQQVKMSYHLAPDEFFEDPEAAGEWTRLAIAAARRAAASKRSAGSAVKH